MCHGVQPLELITRGSLNWSISRRVEVFGKSATRSAGYDEWYDENDSQAVVALKQLTSY